MAKIKSSFSVLVDVKAIYSYLILGREYEIKYASQNDSLEEDLQVTVGEALAMCLSHLQLYWLKQEETW